MATSPRRASWFLFVRRFVAGKPFPPSDVGQSLGPSAHEGKLYDEQNYSTRSGGMAAGLLELGDDKLGRPLDRTMGLFK